MLFLSNWKDKFALNGFWKRGHLQKRIDDNEASSEQNTGPNCQLVNWKQNKGLKHKV